MKQTNTPVTTAVATTAPLPPADSPEASHYLRNRLSLRLEGKFQGYVSGQGFVTAGWVQSLGLPKGGFGGEFSKLWIACSQGAEIFRDHPQRSGEWMDCIQSRARGVSEEIRGARESRKSDCGVSTATWNTIRKMPRCGICGIPQAGSGWSRSPLGVPPAK